MNKLTHQLTGVALGGVLFAASVPVEVCCGVVLGSSAPDWLEISKWVNGVRYSVIPHRTLTHWLTFWWLCLVALMVTPTSPVVYVLQGFCLGAILHIALDSVTPMGVPLFGLRRTRLPFSIAALIVSASALFVSINQQIIEFFVKNHVT